MYQYFPEIPVSLFIVFYLSEHNTRCGVIREQLCKHMLLKWTYEIYFQLSQQIGDAFKGADKYFYFVLFPLYDVKISFARHEEMEMRSVPAAQMTLV